MLLQQCCPANMVDCCMLGPKRARNACLCISGWGSIEQKTPDIGPMDQRDFMSWGGPGRQLTLLLSYRAVVKWMGPEVVDTVCVQMR